MSDWTAIAAAIGAAVSGERDRGHELLMACWKASGPTDHAGRCVLAHYLADTEMELNKEVTSDEIALEEHSLMRDDDLAPLGIPGPHLCNAILAPFSKDSKHLYEHGRVNLALPPAAARLPPVPRIPGGEPGAASSTSVK